MLRFGWVRASSGRDLALAHELLDEAVVDGEAAQLAAAEQVDAAVADVDEGQLVVVGLGDGHERGAHARGGRGRRGRRR